MALVAGLSSSRGMELKCYGIIRYVEALQLYSNTQSHWSSGSTVCFPPSRAAVRVPGMHRVLLLAMSRYR